MFYKIFNKIFNKVFYLLFILIHKIKKNTKKYILISNKIFEYIKVYNKTMLNYKYYNFYKKLIRNIENKYKLNNKNEFSHQLNFRSKYDLKYTYYKNLVFIISIFIRYLLIINIIEDIY